MGGRGEEASDGERGEEASDDDEGATTMVEPAMDSIAASLVLGGDVHDPDEERGDSDSDSELEEDGGGGGDGSQGDAEEHIYDDMDDVAVDELDDVIK